MILINIIVANSTTFVSYYWIDISCLWFFIMFNMDLYLKSSILQPLIDKEQWFLLTNYLISSLGCQVVALFASKLALAPPYLILFCACARIIILLHAAALVSINAWVGYLPTCLTLIARARHNGISNNETLLELNTGV